MIPGMNLLATALTVIAPQTVQWFQFDHVTTGPTGLDTATYYGPVTLTRGSVQPVDRSRYSELGLDWQKSYVEWFVTPQDPLPITRNPDGNGDAMEWNGRRFAVIGDSPWFALDKWTALLCVDIGPATGNITNA